MWELVSLWYLAWPLPPSFMAEVAPKLLFSLKTEKLPHIRRPKVPILRRDRTCVLPLMRNHLIRIRVLLSFFLPSGAVNSVSLTNFPQRKQMLFSFLGFSRTWCSAHLRLRFRASISVNLRDDVWLACGFVPASFRARSRG